MNLGMGGGGPIIMVLQMHRPKNDKFLFLPICKVFLRDEKRSRLEPITFRTMRKHCYLQTELNWSVALLQIKMFGGLTIEMN